MPSPLLRTAATLALMLTAGLAVAPGAMAPASAAPRPQPSAALTEELARQAAERVLQALRGGDAQTRYAQFAPSLKRMTSPELVESQIRRQPKVVSWTITSIEPGVDSSTVLASLQTSDGPRNLVMVIDGDGLVEGYHFDVSDRSAEEVARRFVQAVADGRFVSAGGYLSTDLQEEIPPAALQRKWQFLQRRTGDFVGVRGVKRSEHTSDMKLVMVTVAFRRLTDNLYVILDNANEIIGVDFPIEPPPADAAP
jgi:hypothetical protein